MRADRRRRWILPAILFSGAASFTYEVLWTRILGHVLGASVYAFATMLASFLFGIAAGAALASRLATGRRRAALGFALAQLGTAILSLAAFALSDRLPDVMRTLALGSLGREAGHALVAAGALFPATLCIGATFPFAVRVLARSETEAASASARVYAWSTLGAIIGALGAGFFLVPALGFAGSFQVAAFTNAGLAVLASGATLPLATTESDSTYDVFVNVKGGGVTGQADAVRLGLARAIMGINPATEEALREADLLTRDARSKERKKYGRRGARRGFQFSKR